MYYRKYFLFVCLILCIIFQLLTVNANVQETNEQQSTTVNINEVTPNDLASYIHIDPKDLPTPYYILKEQEDALKA